MCDECNWFWKEDDEKYPSCHFEARCPGDIPPCEEDYYSAEDYE